MLEHCGLFRWPRNAATLLRIVVSFCVSASCARPPDHDHDLPDPGNHFTALVYHGTTDTLRGTILLSDPIIGRPSHLVLQGEHLWMSDRAGSPFIHLIDLRGRRIEYSEGKDGGGPGDFRVISSLSVRPGDTTAMWAFDEESRRLTRLVADSPGEHPRTFETPSGRIVYDMQWISGSHLIAIGDLDTNRIIVGDTLGQTLHIVPDSLLGADSVSVEARRALSNGLLACTNPVTGILAIVFVGAGRIEIHDSSGALRALADVPFATSGSFGRDSDGRWHMRTPWRFYDGCAATATHLYALFSGTRDDIQSARIAPVSGHYIQIFDWGGALDGVWYLDRGVAAIAVSGDTALYAASAETSTVFEYRIPEIPRPDAFPRQRP